MTDDCTLACPVSTVHVSSIQKANVVAISLPLGSFLFCLGQWLKCACRKQNSMDGSKFQDTFFIRFIRWKFGWSAVALKLWLDHWFNMNFTHTVENLTIFLYLSLYTVRYTCIRKYCINIRHRLWLPRLFGLSFDCWVLFFAENTNTLGFHTHWVTEYSLRLEKLLHEMFTYNLTLSHI